MARLGTFSGAAASGLLALAMVTPLAAEEVWVAPTPFVTPGIGSFPWPTSGSGFASLGLSVPDNFSEFVSARVVLIPKQNVVGSYDVYGSVKRNGDVAGAALLFNLAIPANLLAGTVQEVDITPLLAGQFDATSAGNDYVSVFFWFPTAPGLQDATVLGMRFVYETIPLAASQLADLAVSNAKLANDAVTSSKVANDSLIGADIQNGTITGLDLGPSSVNSTHIQDASVGANDINTAQVQQRVAGTCPPGQSIRAISATGTVTCEADTIGVLDFSTTRFPGTINPGTIARLAMGPCPSVAVNGGWMVNGTLAEADRGRIDSSGPDPAIATNWVVTVTNASPAAVTGDWYITCANITGTASAISAPTLQVTPVPEK